MRAAVAGVLVLLLAVLAAFETGVSLRDDDFGYLMWGLQHIGEPWSWVSGPEWSAYFRPLNDLVWWLSARAGLDGAPARWVLVTVWTVTSAGLVLLARDSVARMFTIFLLIVTNQVFVDLLQWRSWLTSGGSLAAVAIGTLAMNGGRSPFLVAASGLLSLGFKEVGAVALAGACAVRPAYRWVGGVLVSATAIASAGAADKLALGFVPGNLVYHAHTLAAFTSLCPAFVALRYPTAPPWAIAGLAGLAFAPPLFQGAVVFVLGCLFLARSWSWLLPVAAGVALPLFGAAQARQYMIEGWMFAVAAIAASPQLRSGPVLWSTVLALGLPHAIDFERARSGLRAQFREQMVFIEEFHPQRADRLYHPDPQWRWNLDALYWVRGGAVLAGEPPEGATPRQVGPLSGVWADLAGSQGDGNR